MSRITLIIVVAIFVFVAGCETVDKDDTVVNPPLDQEDDIKIKNPDADDYVGFAGITKQQCIDAGGNWNECGSPCAGTDADFCIQVCQAQCECGGIAGFSCPEGYKCRLTGKIADEMGVCVPG